MRKAILFLAEMFVMVLVCEMTMAQNRTITGTVKDHGGEAMSGASVIVAGTNAGTYTDEKGNFSIPIPVNAAALIIKYLGYKTLQQPLTASNVMNVALDEDVLGLEETVVTALGIPVEKKKLAYSVQDVSGDQLTAAGNGNTLSALSGKVAGLQVITASGAPGASVYLELRGATSILGDNQPLFVIDGVPIDNSYRASGNPDNGDWWNLRESVDNSNRAIDIDPNNIEAITVLKGAAACALYGIHAAHGAIIITTKKGGAGKGMYATYSSTFTSESVLRLPELQSRFVKGSNGEIENYESFESGSWGPAKDNLYWDPDQPTAFNQYGELITAADLPNAPNAKPFVPYDNANQFLSTGHTFENNIALNGNGDKGGLRITFGSLSQNGIVPLSSFNRYTATLSGNAKLSSKFSIAGSASYVNSGGTRMQTGSNRSGIMLDLLRTPISFDNSNSSDDPTNSSAFLLPDGTQRNYRGGIGYNNPYFSINQDPFVDDVNRMYGYAELNYAPFSWMKFTERIGNDFYSDRRNQHYTINDVTYPAGRVFQQDFFYHHINNDLLVALSKDFGNKLSGTVTLGNNIFNRYQQQNYVQGSNLVLPEFYNISNAANVFTRNYIDRYRTYAFYGILDLAYSNMLYLTLTGRKEASSTLPENNNSFFSSSASASFIFTEPLGLSNNKIFPYGKIRASWAQVGNDVPVYAIQTYFIPAFAWDIPTYGIFFPLPDRNGDLTTSYMHSRILGNPLLTPEKVSSWEIGTDLRFFNNRIGFDFTYYYSKSKDQIVLVPLAGSSGFFEQYLNYASIENKGEEIMLNVTPLKGKNWEWELRLNWSHNKSKVLSLANNTYGVYLGGFDEGGIYAIVGEQYGSIGGTTWIKDNNGNVVINDDPNSEGYGYPIQNTQFGVIGNINPDWIAGASTTLSWKRLRLYVLFDIREGGQIWNGTRGALNVFGISAETDNRGATTVFDGVKGHVDPATGEIVIEGMNDIEAVLDQNWYQGLGGGFGGPAEQFVEDGSYVKLREMSLSYSLNPKWLSETPVAGLEVSLVGRNLWISTAYKGGDPEVSLTGANNSQGMDYFCMPGTRSFGLSIKLTL